MSAPTPAPATAPVSAWGLFANLCDDAAIFPPGNLPLDQALAEHSQHRTSSHRDLVGSFVVAAAVLGDLLALLPDGVVLPVSVTVPSPADLRDALRDACAPRLRVVSVEVGVPPELPADTVVPAVREALRPHHPALASPTPPPGFNVYVELPRDDRRERIVADIDEAGFLAKLRTGGVQAEMYPDEAELAAAVALLVGERVPFKATAGLHHAVRRTDPVTRFEEHGFLNLLLAVSAARGGAGVSEIADVLANRDPHAVAAQARILIPQARAVRQAFRSFGTCSIVDPRDELAALGLLPGTSAHPPMPRSAPR